MSWRKELEDVDRRLTEAGIPHSMHAFAPGNSPSEDLVKVASDTGAEMIIVGLRRRSRVGKAILGSDAKRSCWMPTARSWL
jgi:nucleotide-binding universal stress UspA family protein